MTRKKNNSSIGVLLVLILFVAVGLYVYFSATFERVPPQVVLENSNGYWNLKKPLKINISDTSGVKSYKIIMHTKDGDKTLQYEQLLSPKKELLLKVSPPRGFYTMKDKVIKLIVQAQDISKWDFFKGNFTQQEFTLKIDRKRPNVNIVTNSYKISKGGAALVIFKVNDENLKDIYILSNHNKHFKAEPFYKEGYYIALLAWPVADSAKAYVPLYLKNKTYRVSKIKLSDKFLDGKIVQLSDEFEETQGVTNRLERFKIINEDIRAKNEKLIHKITSKVPTEMISDFKMRRMYPLKNGAVVAHFGDHRKYYYHGKFISEAYHLGLDLASHAMAPIKTQNGGVVVFADFNGLYGNMLALSHGLGLYTIYGHCSSFDVTKGEDVPPNSKIASTGKTGYAMGDHLHFGVLVQGIEVRPQEWMDKHWIKLNISDIIKNAKKIIDQQ
ncbi:Peptidase, M23/M37 family [hydrothermal vent metagenome]|uniref:Peptidase, M23/M37 family n=1 Tax=hydrothermal vent metagenome TaxID=652676 RepID=A0A1W1BYE1_9ZZZZ